jgi:hypothetical protein
MNPNRQLDSLVAEKIMEWEKLSYMPFDNPLKSHPLNEWIRKVGIINYGTYYIDQEKEFWLPVEDFEPSSTLIAAWMIIEILKQKGYKFWLGLSNSKYMCQFAIITEPFETVAIEETAPLAITLASLKALKIIDL